MNVKEKKQAVVDDLTAKLGDAKAIYLADFTGLNVKKITQLRARLRKAGVEYIVVKNTLAERALSGLDLPDITKFFKGPTAVVIGRKDPVEAAKVLSDFAELAGAMQAPMAELLFCLQSKMQEMVGLLEALKEKRGEA